MKKNLWFLSFVLTGMISVSSCEEIKKDDIPENLKPVSEIRIHNEDNGNKLAYGSSHESSEVFSFSYDENKILSGYVREEHSDGNYRKETYTYDYSTGNELRIKSENTSESGSPWTEYRRYILNDRHLVASVWTNYDSDFNHIEDFTKYFDISYSDDGHLSEITVGDAAIRYNYQDGLLISIEETYPEGSEYLFKAEAEDYSNRYPAKGGISNFLHAYCTRDEGMFELLAPAFLGCTGRTSDCLIEKSGALSRYFMPSIGELPGDYSPEPNYRKHYSSKTLKYIEQKNDVEYVFDEDGYVTEMKLKDAFEIIQIDYDMVGGSTPDEHGLYKLTRENYSETIVESGYNYEIIEIKYL